MDINRSPAGDDVLDRATIARRARAGTLPSKTCAACGRPMRWRRAWAKTWHEVRWCSDACRKRRGAAGAAGAAGAPGAPGARTSSGGGDGHAR